MNECGWLGEEAKIREKRIGYNTFLNKKKN
jgi:hypothetical protein